MTRTARSPCTRPGSERGITLVELMVAILILTVGLNALASGAALAAHMAGAGHLQATAASVAQSRFDVLRSRPCGAIVPDSAITRQVRETWAVTNVPNAVVVTLTVTYQLHRKARSQQYRGFIPCI